MFVVGCPRSGTTLLQQMLSSHPDVAIAPETHYIRRFWLRRHEYGDLADDGQFARLIEDIAATPEFAETQVDVDCFRHDAWNGERSHAALFGLFLRLFGSAQGASLVGEKTPNHLLYMGTLRRFFPGARFVCMVRDPRAVVNSWRGVPWSTGSVEGDARVWLRYATAVPAQPLEPAASVLVVMYERLVSDAVGALTEICRFADLPWSDDLLDYHSPQRFTSVNVKREPWKARSAEPVDAGRIQGWREELSAGQVKRIEVVTWRGMRRFGYPFSTRKASLYPSIAVSGLRRRLRRPGRDGSAVSTAGGA